MALISVVVVFLVEAIVLSFISLLEEGPNLGGFQKVSPVFHLHQDLRLGYCEQGVLIKPRLELGRTSEPDRSIMLDQLVPSSFASSIRSTDRGVPPRRHGLLGVSVLLCSREHLNVVHRKSLL